MKRRLINALRAGSAALDRLAQAVAAGEPDELEQVRARLAALEANQRETLGDLLAHRDEIGLLQDWARAWAKHLDQSIANPHLPISSGEGRANLDAAADAARKAAGPAVQAGL